MIKQFYEKVLPSQGVYCVSGINTAKIITQRFAETLEEVVKLAEKFKTSGTNVYITPASYEGKRRSAKECAYVKSFFIDIDTHGKDAYESKEATKEAANKLLESTGLPEPVYVDSGGGIHAYWIMDRDITYEEWLPYAEKLKFLCAKHISIDMSVTDDAARLMRCPDTVNYRYTPPINSAVISDNLCTYDFDEFKEFLDTQDVITPEKVKTIIDDVFANVKKGLDEDTLAMKKLDNFEFSFRQIAERSLDGVGCNQIKYMLEKPDEVPRDQWAGGLTIAIKCVDGDTAIHTMSEDYNKYSYEETEKTARNFDGVRTCKWFKDNFPDHCKGCIHQGHINTPIVLGKELQVQKPESADNISALDQEDTVWEVQNPEKIPELPDFLKPFARGEKGGIYYYPPPKITKAGVPIPQEPILIFAHELFPTRRMFSPLEGECLRMQAHFPNDAVREFVIPVKGVYALEKLKEYLSSNGIFYEPDQIMLAQKYIVKWGQWMVYKFKADIMRMQMGWTEEFTSKNWSERSFVIGNREITHDGDEIRSAASPLVRGIAKFLSPVGEYDAWKVAVKELDRPEFELHAFTLFTGFGSVLMPYLSTSGVTVSLLGRSGSAKTGALYAGLSIFGNPKELSVFEATDNGMTGRYLGLHNLLLGVDEIGNKDPKSISQLIHKVSHGKAKIRMQASVNAEREHEMSAALIQILTTNESAYNKVEIIKGSPDGETARLIEFLIKKPSALQFEGGGKLGRDIFDTFRTNFGHAGPDYVKAIFKLGDKHIKERMMQWRVKFIADFGDDSTYRFHENLIVASFTGAEIAKDAGIIDLELEHIYKHVVNQMIHIRENVIKINKTDYESILGDYVYKKLDKILVIKGDKATLEPRGPIVARIEVEESMLIVSKSDFKEYLNLLKITPREFEDDMRTNGVLIHDKKARLTTGWKSAVSPVNINAYWFKTPIPTEWLNGDPDADS